MGINNGASYDSVRTRSTLTVDEYLLGDGTGKSGLAGSMPPLRRSVADEAHDADCEGSFAVGTVEEITLGRRDSVNDQMGAKRKRSSIVEFGRSIRSAAKRFNALVHRMEDRLPGRDHDRLENDQPREELSCMEEVQRLVALHKHWATMVSHPFVFRQMAEELLDSGRLEEVRGLLDSGRFGEDDLTESGRLSTMTTVRLSDVSTRSSALGPLLRDDGEDQGCCDGFSEDEEGMFRLSISSEPSVSYGQRQTYAHHAWTPEDQFEPGSEERQIQEQAAQLLNLERGCMERFQNGRFDQEAIAKKFEDLHDRRSSAEQQTVSAEFRRTTQNREEQGRLEFERSHGRSNAVGDSQGSTASRVGVLASIIGEVYGRSGGVGF